MLNRKLSRQSQIVNLKSKKGFTLIELVVVMAIIALLALLIIGAIIVARRTATETANRSNAKTVQVALESRFAATRQYPVVNGNINAAANLTALGLVVGNLSATACADTGGAVVTGSTATTYTINVNTWQCAANYNANDQITNPQ